MDFLTKNFYQKILRFQVKPFILKNSYAFILTKGKENPLTEVAQAS